MRAFFLLSFLSILFSVNSSKAQSWIWAETAGGVLPDEANGCFQDANGNMYMSGFYFSSDINFGNGNSLSNNGISDGFIVKYNASGSTQWASKVKGSSEDKATKCTADRFGNVFVTGYYDSPSIQFGGNNNDNVSNSDNNGGTFDAFIVKYNGSGSPEWYHSIGEDDDDGGASVAADSAGNVYVTGWFRATSVTLSSSVSIYNSSQATGPSDMFLIKYDQNGTVLWARSAGGPDDDKGRGVTVDPDGNVIVTGYFKDPSITIEGNNYASNGSKDFFVIKYDSDGNLLDAKTYGGSGGEEAFACSADGNGNVYVCGNYSSSSATFDNVTITNPGNGSGSFLLKLDSDLIAVWAKGFASGSSDEALGCSADRYGNVAVTGIFSGNTLNIESYSLHNNGGDEIYLAKYNPNGDLFWATKIGKSNDDGANDCSMTDDGRIVVAGYYNSGSLTLGNIDLDNSYFGVATSDPFIATTCYAQAGTHAISACGEYTWIDGNTYTSSTNDAIWSFPNSNSCDSIVTLDLTMNTVDVSVTNASPDLIANSNGATYRWLDCNSNYVFLAGETAQTFTALSNGSYAVEVTENACVDTSDCVDVNNITVGLLETDGPSISVYPNPTTSDVTLQFNRKFSGSLTGYDAQGRIVFAESIISKNNLELNLPETKGVFTIRLISEAGVSQQFRILKQ